MLSDVTLYSFLTILVPEPHVTSLMEIPKYQIIICV